MHNRFSVNPLNNGYMNPAEPNSFQQSSHAHMMNPNIMIQQQMMAHQQQQMANQQQMLYQQQMAQQHMYQQREEEKRMKQLARLQQKQMELLHGKGIQGFDMSGVQLPRLTKSVAEEFIALNLKVSPTQLNFVKVFEDMSQMRHACKHGGVQKLEVSTLYYGTTPIKAGVCKYCGTVHYHYDMEPSIPQGY